jgi:hypothetical protein
LPLGSESARKNPSALTTHLENSLMECRWKSCLPALQILPVRSFTEAIPESKLPNSGNLFLELAKGFEPLTL